MNPGKDSLSLVIRRWCLNLGENMKQTQTTEIRLTVIHEGNCPDLAQMVAGRAWTIDGVRSVEVAASVPINVDTYKIKPTIAESDLPRWLVTT